VCVPLKDHEPKAGAQARQNEWDYFVRVRNGVFCEVGKGNVDFPPVLKEDDISLIKPLNLKLKIAY
jgi:sugar phosphate isomerase/epimerase